MPFLGGLSEKYNYLCIIKQPIRLRMDDTKKLLLDITEGIQEKKGKQIVIADLTDIDDTICQYFVVCQGNSPMQVSAIADSIEDFTIKRSHVKPVGIDGQRNATWIAMDYANVMVHVFLPEAREFYNLEHLWADAKLTNIPDLD
jgi:ribosome-associated protein